MPHVQLPCIRANAVDRGTAWTRLASELLGHQTVDAVSRLAYEEVPFTTLRCTRPLQTRRRFLAAHETRGRAWWCSLAPRFLFTFNISFRLSWTPGRICMLCATFFLPQHITSTRRNQFDGDPCSSTGQQRYTTLLKLVRWQSLHLRVHFLLFLARPNTSPSFPTRLPSHTGSLEVCLLLASYTFSPEPSTVPCDLLKRTVWMSAA